MSTKTKKIEIHADGEYILTTDRFPSCRAALDHLLTHTIIYIAGRGPVLLYGKTLQARIIPSNN